MNTTVSVFGLGYVGCVSVACLAKEGHEVIGVDVVDTKVNAIADGLATVVEPEVDALLLDAKRRGVISATKDFIGAVHGTDMSLVCVGTPSGRDGSLDLSYIAETARNIGRALRTKDGYHIVALRSTVPPGTVEELLVPNILHWPSCWPSTPTGWCGSSIARRNCSRRCAMCSTL